MKEVTARDPAYMAFRRQLEADTRLDAVAYVEWIHRNVRALRTGFECSGELDSTVYCRMRYVEYKQAGISVEKS